MVYAQGQQLLHQENSWNTSRGSPCSRHVIRRRGQICFLHACEITQPSCWQHNVRRSSSCGSFLPTSRHRLNSNPTSRQRPMLTMNQVNAVCWLAASKLMMQNRMGTWYGLVDFRARALRDEPSDNFRVEGAIRALLQSIKL